MDNMEPIEQELQELRNDLERQKEELDENSELTKEIHAAIIGTKMLPKAGIVHRLEIVERNINTLTQSQLHLEKKIDDYISSQRELRASSLVKFNIMWLAFYGGIEATLLFVIQELFKLLKH